MAYSLMELLQLLIPFLRPAVPSDEAPRAPEETAVDEGPPPRISRVGAWCGFASMVSDAAVRRDINFSASVGLLRLDILVNDFSSARAERRFETYSVARIKALATAANNMGWHVHLTSWLMPHERFIRDGAEKLSELATDCGARSVVFDVEEPWTQASKPMPYAEAAELVGSTMKVEWGVTAIGYASQSKLGKLIGNSSTMIPQCYATATSGLDPTRASIDLVARWRRLFGERRLVVALAAYGQKGIAGYTVEQALHAAFLGAESTHPFDVVYWSLGAMRREPKVAAAIRSLCTRTQPLPDATI